MGIIILYFLAVYWLRWLASLSVLICMTIPSYALFWTLGKYRDSRLLLTFCFVDTIFLILGFVTRWLGMIAGTGGQAVVILATAGIFLAFHRQICVCVTKFRELLEIEGANWNLMAFASVLIYFTCIFLAAYPRAMVTRMEYAPQWLIFGGTSLASYAVFIQSMIKTREIVEKNQRLEHEKEIYQIAYTDSLTGLYNRAAMMERINRLESGRGSGWKNLCCIMLDMNNFKVVNDTFGHFCGDQLLCQVADCLRLVFTEYQEYVFRNGGDEFFIVLTDPDKGKAEVLLKQMEDRIDEISREFPLEISIAFGCQPVFWQEPVSIEEAMMLADCKMYQEKRRKKGEQQG